METYPEGKTPEWGGEPAPVEGRPSPADPGRVTFGARSEQGSRQGRLASSRKGSGSGGRQLAGPSDGRALRPVANCGR
jgi:hypothetical protein